MPKAKKRPETTPKRRSRDRWRRVSARMGPFIPQVSIGANSRAFSAPREPSGPMGSEACLYLRPYTDVVRIQAPRAKPGDFVDPLEVVAEDIGGDG